MTCDTLCDGVLMQFQILTLREMRDDRQYRQSVDCSYVVYR
jgi:hypothetical protein